MKVCTRNRAITKERMINYWRDESQGSFLWQDTWSSPTLSWEWVFFLLPPHKQQRPFKQKEQCAQSVTCMVWVFTQGATGRVAKYGEISQASDHRGLSKLSQTAVYTFTH